MATPKATTSEVTKSRDSFQGVACVLYKGTKNALVAEGFCRSEWFPSKLVPQYRKDGRPYSGNNGKQRTQRTYKVTYRNKLIVLTHRLDACGKVYWLAHVVDVKQMAEHKAKQEEERKEWLRNLNRRRRELASSTHQSVAPASPLAEAPSPRSAAFDVGDRAICHCPGATWHGNVVRIAKGYGLHSVNDDGETTELWGYIAREESTGESHFFSAGWLREFVEKPFHLRLATDKGRAAAMEQPDE